MSQNALKTEVLDMKFMSYALNLSKKNLGICAENPSVGCVITHENQIIASGVTAKGGRPHAETIAIEKVSDKDILQNCTIYVTLEPCSHTGKTKPCVDEIIKHKFKKVVIATKDSNPMINGDSIRQLQEAGIEVICGVLENEAREMNRGFFKTKEKGRPFITLKIASSLDGKIATKNFDSKWITSERSRQFGHFLRAKNDAIIIGGETARKDNPMLDCRIPGLEEFSPMKIVISQNLDLDPELNIFKNNPNKTLVFTTSDKKFSPAKTIICQEKNQQIDLEDVIKKLSQHGFNAVLIEGGSRVATAFLKENLIDEIVWIRSSKIIGNDGISAIGDLNFSEISQALHSFKRTEIRESADDLIEIYRIS